MYKYATAKKTASEVSVHTDFRGCWIHQVRLIFLFFTIFDFYSSTREIKSISQLILDVSRIRKMHRCGIVDEKDEGGWFHTRLCTIVHLQSFGSDHRRLFLKQRLPDDIIQDTRADFLVVVVIASSDHAQDLVCSLSCQR